MRSSDRLKMIYFSHYLINCLQKHFLLFLTYLLYVFCFCHCINAKPFPLFKSFFRAGACLLPMSSLFARLQEVQPIKHWFILDKTNWENKLPGMYFSAESNYSQKKTLLCTFNMKADTKPFFKPLPPWMWLKLFSDWHTYFITAVQNFPLAK